MPHFVMDCSENVLEVREEDCIIAQIHDVAASSGLFVESEIKVRINAFKRYSVGNAKEGFIHVFAHIMEGRTDQQKAELSKHMVCRLAELFPLVPNIAMNISDFEKNGYCNRNAIKTI